MDALFRPKWSKGSVSLDVLQRRLADPDLIAQIDAAARGISGTKADTRTLILALANTAHGSTEAEIRREIERDLAREKGARATITGRVIDENLGRPISGAIVSDASGSQARTDLQGEYSLVLWEPSTKKLFWISVEAPGFALNQSAMDWTDLPKPPRVDFRLVPSVIFGGRVIDPEGKPIAGADVQLWLRSGATCRDDSFARRGLGNSTVLRSITDADGMYCFRHLPPDTMQYQSAYRLIVTHPEYQNRMKSYGTNESPGPGWQITLEPGRKLGGIVVDDQGRPVANALVTVVLRPVVGSYPTATTDREGRFLVGGLPTGPVDVVVRPTDHVAAQVSANVQDNATELKIVVARGEYIAGKVVDKDGKPVADAYVGYAVKLDKAGNPVANAAGNTLGTRQVRSLADGTFRVGPLAPETAGSGRSSPASPISRSPTRRSTRRPATRT